MYRILFVHEEGDLIETKEVYGAELRLCSTLTEQCHAISRGRLMCGAVGAAA